MPRGRSATYDDQRELILAQAAQLFARRGYPATSMNQVAEACNLSKATLYHYYKDKSSLLISIAETHVSKLAALVAEEEANPHTDEERLRRFIYRIVEEYAGAQDAHRVLTDDVRFLADEDRERVLDQERAVVAGFARAVSALRPGAPSDELAKPLTMLLFGMINWMFTWMKPGGRLDHAAIAPIVADLFLGGVGAVKMPPAAPSQSAKESG
ncbi:TetR/AcrR family transcriptional regulator [Variovorax sp. RO1]|uniref:TetR/AcrR family transcriptional regulator n=1 Tax=Variovorax sp. RO1 TaxID=2066034 RepID=UPI000C71713B|nr:TetR/AcrR family transcriptional regulator [Variovorax sp. RO1]PLC02211.1 TetR/AcrR family transcriptional regulator [Variovorax sp. RO1]